jgi:outer membrane protein TolC
MTRNSLFKENAGIRSIKISLLFTCIVVFILSAKGQQLLTLPDAINIALNKNFNIQIAKNNVDISRINNNIGVAGALPSVNANIGETGSLNSLNQKLSNGNNTNRNNTGASNTTAGVTGSILLYNGFRVYATKSRLNELENQSRQLLNEQIQNTIAAVMVKYYDVVRQQNYITAIQQTIEVTRKRKEIVDVRQSVGLANNADTYQAQIDLNNSIQELQNQQLILDQDITDLVNLISEKPGTQYTIKDTITLDNTIHFDSILAAIQHNPQLRAASSQIAINEWIEKETATQRYPSVRLNGGYNYSRNQSTAGLTLLNQLYGPFIGLSVAIPIYNGGVFKRQQQAAAISTNISTLQMQSIENDLQTSAFRNWQAYQSILQRLESARENYKLANDLVELNLQKLQLGNITIIDFRVAQQSLQDAAYQLVNLNYAAKAAEIELKRLASQLGV